MLRPVQAQNWPQNQGAFETLTLTTVMTHLFLYLFVLWQHLEAMVLLCQVLYEHITETIPALKILQSNQLTVRDKQVSTQLMFQLCLHCLPRTTGCLGYSIHRVKWLEQHKKALKDLVSAGGVFPWHRKFGRQPQFCLPMTPHKPWQGLGVGVAC